MNVAIMTRSASVSHDDATRSRRSADPVVSGGRGASAGTRQLRRPSQVQVRSEVAWVVGSGGPWPGPAQGLQYAVQRKLEVGAVDDPLEREGDRVAD